MFCEVVFFSLYTSTVLLPELWEHRWPRLPELTTDSVDWYTMKLNCIKPKLFVKTLPIATLHGVAFWCFTLYKDKKLDFV